MRHECKGNIVQKGPTPYRQPPPPRSNAPIQGAPLSRTPKQGQYQAPPTEKPHKPSLKSRVKFTTLDEALAIDKKSADGMRMLALAFLFFYVLLVASKLIVDYRTTQQIAQAEHLTFSQAITENISTEIQNAVIWINNGLSEGQTPAQSARLIARSPVVAETAILNAKGEIIASYPRRPTILSSIPIQNIETETIKLNSIIQPNGLVIPLIIKKTGRYFVVTALAENALVDGSKQTTDKTIVVAASGRVIAANSTLGKLGAREVFHLSEAQFSKLTQPGIKTTESIIVNGRKHLLAAVEIPNSNSNLFLFQSKPRIGTSVLQNNLLLFLLLFLGTCALIWALLNSLKKQLRIVQGVQQTTEISQQRYQAAIEGDRGGVWEVDLADNVAFVSASLAGLLGLLRQEQTMPLAKFLRLFHPDDRERFLAFARRAHLHGEFDFDIRVAHLPLVLQCRGRSSTRSGHERKQVIVGVALDITEQRAAQIRLKATEARLHNALSSMTDSFVVWDAYNRLVIWNNRFEEFFGLASGSLHVGMEHASVEYLANAAIEDRFHYENADGRWVEYLLKNGRWIRYIETQTIEGGHVSVGTDITELRLREADLKANEIALNNTVDVLRKSQKSIVELAERYESEKIRAEEASQSKSDFLASMSHELRTPLNAINGFSDIMQKEMFGPLGDPRYKEYVNDILFSGQHLLSLINDILDMSKIEAGKMTLNTEVMYLHELVAQVVRMIRGRADDANLQLDVEVDEVKEIEADPRSVKQVLLNLLTNAVKFTPEGGTVSVELIQKISGVVVKVSDTGIGISPENIEKLAKPFEQVHDETTKQAEGTGLGLALSKSLVELHGGKFQIESLVGKGTTVIFSLPNRPIIPQEEEPREDVSQEISKITADIANILGQTAPVPDGDNTTARPPEQASQMPEAFPEANPEHSQGLSGNIHSVGKPAAYG